MTRRDAARSSRARRARGIAAALVASLTISLAQAPAFAAPPPKSTAVDPTALPVLKGAEVKQPPIQPADPKADFTPLMGTGKSSFDPQRSKVVSSSTFVDEYENPDGTRTIKQSTEPRNVKDALGNWRPVDTTLVADTPTRRVKAKTHPLKPAGVRYVSHRYPGKHALLAKYAKGIPQIWQRNLRGQTHKHRKAPWWKPWRR